MIPFEPDLEGLINSLNSQQAKTRMVFHLVMHGKNVPPYLIEECIADVLKKGHYESAGDISEIIGKREYAEELWRSQIDQDLSHGKLQAAYTCAKKHDFFDLIPDLYQKFLSQLVEKKEYTHAVSIAVEFNDIDQALALCETGELYSKGAAIAGKNGRETAEKMFNQMQYAHHLRNGELEQAAWSAKKLEMQEATTLFQAAGIQKREKKDYQGAMHMFRQGNNEEQAREMARLHLNQLEDRASYSDALDFAKREVPSEVAKYQQFHDLYYSI